ncbi:MAG: DNA-3-methyladenine glycosylase 2 [Cyclobacteriaceae bacterium]
MLLKTPREFSFQLCLDFLKRSPTELLHQLHDNGVVKALGIGNQVTVFEVSPQKNALQITFLSKEPDESAKQLVAGYVREWFDLDTDLKPFYSMAENDRLLRDLIARYYGYRIVGQPDLFESLIWAVLGQQINLGFAYTLKRRFVQTFGERLALNDNEYFLFPTPNTVAVITPEKLLALQFSSQKSRYTIGIAEAFAGGTLSKEKIKGLPLQEAKHELMKIKGIGNWTANYALMKTFHYPDAFPLEDAGLHNAIKNLKKLSKKPTLPEVVKIFKKYKGWEAYATLYLWKSL